LVYKFCISKFILSFFGKGLMQNPSDPCILRYILLRKTLSTNGFNRCLSYYKSNKLLRASCRARHSLGDGREPVEGFSAQMRIHTPINPLILSLSKGGIRRATGNCYIYYKFSLVREWFIYPSTLILHSVRPAVPTIALAKAEGFWHIKNKYVIYNEKWYKSKKQIIKG